MLEQDIWSENIVESMLSSKAAWGSEHIRNKSPRGTTSLGKEAS